MKTINGVSALETIEELVDPRYTAVLTIDMQNETASYEGGYAKHGYDISRIRSIIPTVQKVLKASRRLELLVGFTEFVHRDRRGVTLMDGPNVHLHSNEEWVSDVIEGSREAETLPELAPHPKELVISKSRASVIYNTYLGNILRTKDIRTVILMGCLTDGCILKTAVDLTQNGYYPVVVKDAVNSLTAEKHEIGLRYIEMKFPVYTADDILSVWAELG